SAAVLGLELGAMDSPPPRLPDAGRRMRAGAPALTGLIYLIGVVLAAQARRNLTTIFKAAQFVSPLRINVRYLSNYTACSRDIEHFFGFSSFVKRGSSTSIEVPL